MQSAENQKLTKKGLAIFEEMKRNVTNLLDELKSEIDELMKLNQMTYNKVNSLGSEIAVVKGVVTVMEGDMAVMKGDMAVMKGDMAEVKISLLQRDQVVSLVKAEITDEMVPVQVEPNSQNQPTDFDLTSFMDKEAKSQAMTNSASPEEEATDIIDGADQGPMLNNGGAGGGSSETQSNVLSETGYASDTGPGNEDVKTTPINAQNATTVVDEYEYDIALCDPLDLPELQEPIRKFQMELEGLVKVRVKNFYEDSFAKQQIVLVDDVLKQCRFCFIMFSSKAIERETPEHDIIIRFLTYTKETKGRYWDVIPVYTCDIKKKDVLQEFKGIRGIKLYDVSGEGDPCWIKSVQNLLKRK